MHQRVVHAARRVRASCTHIENRLGIKPGQTTPDGAFTLVEEECLAACANAPMMICGDQYFLDLDEKKVDMILDDLRKRWQARQKSTTPTSLPAVGSSAVADFERTLTGVGPEKKV